MSQVATMTKGNEMSQVATTISGTAVATTGANAYESYGNAVSSRAIVGELLKFNKGEFTAGQDDDEVDIGTQLIANMDDLAVGWVKWEDGKPVEHVMGRVADGHMPEKRSALGDLDKDQWETDKDDRPLDPWSETNYLLLKERDGDQVYTFSAASKGGRNAIADLCKSYGKAMRQHPDEYPIIELGKDSYKHKDYGKVFVPTLKLVGWVSKDGFSDAVDAANAERDEEEAKEAPAPAAATKATKSAAKF